MTNLGYKLQQIRKYKGFTQKELITKSGLDVTQQVFSKYENGGVRIPAETLYVLAKVLGVTMDSFFPPVKKSKPIGGAIVLQALDSVQHAAEELSSAIAAAKYSLNDYDLEGKK